MHDTELISLYAQKGIALDQVNGKLRLKALQGAVSPEDRLLLQTRRRSLIRTLAHKHAMSELARTWEQISSTQIHEEAPLTPYQEIFYLLSYNNEAINVVNQVGSFNLVMTAGEPEPHIIMQRALAGLAMRHPMLRAYIYLSPSMTPLQRIAKDCPIPLSVYHTAGVAEHREAINATIREYRNSPYDLTTPPLWRAALFIGENEHATLVLGFHHLIMDGWSISILAQDLAIFLEGEQAGSKPNLVDIPLTYMNYAYWLHEKCLPLIEKKQLSFWQNRLAGVPVQHSIPIDFIQNPSTQNNIETRQFHHSLRRVELGADFLKNISRWTTHHGCSLFSALYTALRLVLYKIEDNTDTPVLTVAANRQLPGQELIVGCFVNAVPLISPIKPELSIKDTLLESHTCLLDTLDNQITPFQNVVSSIGIKRHKDRIPISQVFLTIQNAYSVSGPSSLTPCVPDYPISAYDLAFIIWDFGEKGCAVHLEYDNTLFTEERMDNLLSKFLEQAQALPCQEKKSVKEVCSNILYSNLLTHHIQTQRDNKIESLNELIHLELYDYLIFDNLEIDPDNLIRKTASLLNITIQSSIDRQSDRVLVCMNRLPREHEYENADILIVNHLPPAKVILQFAEKHIRFLLNLPGTSTFTIADISSIKTGYETHINSTLHNNDYIPHREKIIFSSQCSIETSHDGNLILPLPGGGSPLIWRKGYAVNLDVLVSQYNFNSKTNLTDIALGLVIPLPHKEIPSIIEDEGEMVVWGTKEALSSKEFDDFYSHLPPALRPVHRMLVDRLPYYADGNLHRNMLTTLPLYTDDIIARVSNNIILRNRPISTSDVILFSPYFNNDSALQIFNTDYPVPDWNFLLDSEKQGIVILSETTYDLSCINLLIHNSNSHLLLCGENAEDILKLLNTQKPIYALKNISDLSEYKNKNTKIGWIIDIVSQNKIKQEEHNTLVSYLRTIHHGITTIHLLIHTDTSSSTRYIFDELYENSIKMNIKSPHSDLIIVMQEWGRFTNRTEENAWQELSASLQSGKDALLIGILPESLGWRRISCNEPEPVQEIVFQTDSSVSPNGLPHPLRNAFGEAGPYAIEQTPVVFGGTEKDVRIKIASIWKQILHTETTDPDVNFFDLGGTSVMAPQLQEHIKQAFQVDIGAAGVFMHPSLRELTDAVLEAINNANNSNSAQEKNLNLEVDIRKKVASIWQQILHTEDIDPDANFFDLGGNSVMAPQLQEHIKQAFQVDIGAAGVFMHPSLRELTNAVLQAIRSTHSLQIDNNPKASLSSEQSALLRAARTKRQQQARLLHEFIPLA